jgi:hypothetical protein
MMGRMAGQGYREGSSLRSKWPCSADDGGLWVPESSFLPVVVSLHVDPKVCGESLNGQHAAVHPCV